MTDKPKIRMAFNSHGLGDVIHCCHAMKLYQSRGVTVCDRWLESFEAFLSDMGERPSISHTLDRKDNSGNYDLANCRWATWHEQHRNKRTNHHITINGETQILTDWCARFGIAITTVCARIAKGMNPVDAVSLPVQSKSRNRGSYVN